MTEAESISFEYFHWGPLICKYSTDLTNADKLTKLGRKRQDFDYRQNLAGHIDHEFGFTGDDQEAFVKWYGKYFDSYVAEYTSRFGESLGGLELESLWINFMKAGDFNPPHTHSGHISFVLFTSDTTGLAEEQETFKGTGPKPGSIIFTYGEGLYTNTPMWSIINHYHLPKKGDLYIFPSLTKHWVAPFKTDLERVSVSGNLLFKEKMGNAGSQ